MTLELGRWLIGNIEEFSKNVTSAETKYRMCIRRVATITSLKPRITEEDTPREICLVQE